jgi:hypothetical protein
MTIVAIDGGLSDNGPFDGRPALYQSAQTDDTKPEGRTIPSLDATGSRASFDRLRAAA